LFDVFRDVLAAMSRGEKAGDDDAGGNDQYCTMGISELRRRAHAEGLEVDGSRETLIAALE